MSSAKHVRKLSRGAVILSCVFRIAIAHAQSRATPLAPDLAARRRLLIIEAQSASERGEHDHALDLAQQAAAIQLSPSLAQLIAAEQTALNRPADALGTAALCVDRALADESTPHRDEQIAACRSIIERAEHEVGRVELEFAREPAAVVRVLIGGHDLGAGWRGPQPVTPGVVAIDVQEPGYVAFHREVTVERGNTVYVRVEQARDVSIAPVAAPVARPAAVVGTRRDDGTAMRVTGSVVLGIGALALAGGIAGNVAYASTAAEFNGPTSSCWLNAGVAQGGAHCGTLLTQASTEEALSIAGYAASAALAITGAVLFLAAPHASHERGAHAWMQCGASASPAEVRCSARF